MTKAEKRVVNSAMNYFRVFFNRPYAIGVEQRAKLFAACATLTRSRAKRKGK